MTIRTNYTVNKTPRFSFLSEDQKDRLFRGVIKTLNDTGANVNHEGVRELLGKNRCNVDGKRVRIPPEVVKDALSSLPPTTTLYSWDGSEEMVYVEKGRSYFGPGPTPPNFIDPYTLERRPYVRKDAEIVARVCDALPNIGYVQSLGSINDVTNGLADVYEFADMIQHTRKIIMNWAFNVENIKDEHKIGIIMAGGEEAFRQRPNFIHYSEPISPLTSDFDAIGKCMYCAEHRIPQVYTPCCIGGATVPATHAGQLVVAMSEAMVGVVVSQLMNPGTCIIIGGVQSILDMRRAIYSYGAPELGIMSAAFTELLSHVGLPMYSTSGCTDTKMMELQSGIEAAYSIQMAMYSGANFVHDNGYTESGITGDVYQTIMDDEIIGMCRLIGGGVEVNEETLAVEEICSVGPGGHYLYEDHTMKHFRNHWVPTLMDRNSYEDWDAQGRTTMKERIVKKGQDIIENYPGPSVKVPAEAKADIDKVLAAAEERVKSL